MGVPELRRATGRRLRRAEDWARGRAAWLLAGSIAAHVVLMQLPKATTMIDLLVYRHAPPSILDGHLYDFRLGEFSDQFPLPFTYPPFAALVFLPLSWFPWWVVRYAWHAASIGALWWILNRTAALVVGPAAQQQLWRRRVLLWTAVALWTEPVRTTLNYGQINLLLVAALITAVSTRRDSLAGLSVGLATGIKLTPAVTGLYFVLRRRWAAAGWSAVWFAVTVTLGWLAGPEQSRLYWFQLLGDPNRIGPVGSAINQSLRGALSRTMGYDVGSGALWVAAALLAIGLAGSAVLAARRTGDGFAMLIVIEFLGLLLSPISWSHHWVWAVPALFWLLHGRARLHTGIRVAAGAWVFVLVSYVVPILVTRQQSIWTIPRPWYLAALGWAYPLAALITLGAVAGLLRPSATGRLRAPVGAAIATRRGEPDPGPNADTAAAAA